MLVSFTVKNFGSIYKPVTISLAKCNSTEKKTQIIEKKSVFPVFGIYGANASGKSTLLQAFNFLQSFILGELKVKNKGDKIPYRPFAFSDTACKEASEFTVEFVYEETLYEYALFCNDTCIVHEHLYSWPNSRQSKIFEREFQNFTFTKRNEKMQKPLAERTLENRPYLYTSNEWNLKQTEAAFLWFRHIPRVDLLGMGWPALSFSDLEFPNKKENILRELKYADLDICDIKKLVKEKGLPFPHTSLTQMLQNVLDIPDDIDAIDIKVSNVDFQTIHAINGKISHLELSDESEGTRKYLHVIGGVLRALEYGHLLMMDEFESSLHPLLARHIVELFQNPERNTGGGQLIFVSHNTTLLDLELLQKSQIGLVEKDIETGETDLYTMEDISGIKRHENIAKGYLQGRYGAIPFLT